MADDSLPVLPLKDLVLLPYAVMPVAVGRPASLAAVEAALTTEEKTLIVVAQRDISVDEPQAGDLFSIGVRGVIRRLQRGEHGMELILQGVERVEIGAMVQTAPYLRAIARSAPVAPETGPEIEALTREILGQAERIQAIVQAQPQLNIRNLAAQSENPMQFVYLLAALVGLEAAKAQEILEASTHRGALTLLHQHLIHEIQVLELQQQIAKQAGSEIGRQQREFMLRQQLRAIQEELGEQSPEESEAAELRKRLEERNLPEPVRKEAERELHRLETIPAAAPDFQITRTHLELILELPWNEDTADNLDLRAARAILDEDHYGLAEIKERIVEHLAVMKLNPGAQAPILCFVGPPGVGKTSLGQSIARALGRKFERMSLGGLHDESELRGHRRTYVGAMPGRIIQAIRRAGVRNPLLMLDEIDKLDRGFRGDPASALLEILDPAQNREFHDNYLELPFDLSRVFFITTANTTDTIPRPLLDRMELLRLSGYTEEEKLQIARRYLLPRQRKQAGLSEEMFLVPDDVLHVVIRRYTREAGVRELERLLGRLARKAAVRVADGLTEPIAVRVTDLPELLGPERFFLEEARKELPPGVATGLAWTESGGDVLYVEALALAGEGGRLTLTGQLGDVMKESATAAQSYIISHARALGIEPPRADVHIHVPAGAIPKDGPSAGVTMAAALASLFTGQPTRSDTAMTGEITLTGLVLPVGGIKEKVLAAHRSGIRRVILPADNEKDLRDLAPEVRSQIEFVFARTIDDVLGASIPALSARLAGARAQ